jgi:hypothetical protein
MAVGGSRGRAHTLGEQRVRVAGGARLGERQEMVKLRRRDHDKRGRAQQVGLETMGEARWAM